jgi:hypothetical protein
MSIERPAQSPTAGPETRIKKSGNWRATPHVMVRACGRKHRSSSDHTRSNSAAPNTMRYQANTVNWCVWM